MAKQKILKPMTNERRAGIYLRTRARFTGAQARRIRKHARRVIG